MTLSQYKTYKSLSVCIKVIFIPLSNIHTDVKETKIFSLFLTTKKLIIKVGVIEKAVA